MATLSPVTEGASSEEWPGRSGSASPLGVLEGLDAGSVGSQSPRQPRPSDSHASWSPDAEALVRSPEDLGSTGHCSPGAPAGDSDGGWARDEEGEESDDASEAGAGARVCLVTRKPIGLKLRNARVSDRGEPRGGVVEAVNIKSQLLGHVGAGDEVVAVQRLPAGAADGPVAEAIWRAAPVLSLTQVAFEDVMGVLKELSRDLKAGRPCRVFVRTT